MSGCKPNQGRDTRYDGVDRGKSARSGKGSVGPQVELRGWGWGVRLYSKLDGDVVMWKGGGSERLWAEPEKRM